MEQYKRREVTVATVIQCYQVVLVLSSQYSPLVQKENKGGRPSSIQCSVVICSECLETELQFGIILYKKIQLMFSSDGEIWIQVSIVRRIIQNREYIEILFNFEWFVCVSAKTVHFISKVRKGGRYSKNRPPSDSFARYVPFPYSYHGDDFQFILQFHTDSFFRLLFDPNIPRAWPLWLPFWRLLPHHTFHGIFSLISDLPFCILAYIALRSSPQI